MQEEAIVGIGARIHDKLITKFLIDFVREKYGVELVEKNPEPEPEPEPSSEPGGSEVYRVLAERYEHGQLLQSCIYIVGATDRQNAANQAGRFFQDAFGWYPTNLGITVAFNGSDEVKVWIGVVVDSRTGEEIMRVPVLARNQKSAAEQAEVVATELDLDHLGHWEEEKRIIGRVHPIEEVHLFPPRAIDACAGFVPGRLEPSVLVRLGGEYRQYPEGFTRVIPLYLWLRKVTRSMQDPLDVDLDIIS